MDGNMHSSSLAMPQSLFSPRASSPLTPPATGEAKANRGHASDEERPSHLTAGSMAAATSRALSASPPYHPAYPIRDSPRNPFLSGGAADAGLSGPRKWQARQRMACIPPREYGKMTYVFRGQRVTYADPYASEEDEEEEDDFGSVNVRRDEYGYALPKRTMDRMQPCLLFPHASTSSAPEARLTESAVLANNKRPALASRQERQQVGHDETYKRCRTDLSSESRLLLERLERAGWRSDGEEDDEDDEVRSVDTARQYYSHSRQQYLSDDDDDADDEDGEEVDDNPFLDAAPPLATASSSNSQRPISNLPSRAWHQPQVQMQVHHRFAQQPRGHAHTLAHMMHIPEHLKCRRY